MTGTLINALAIIVGSCLGMGIGNRFSPRVQQIIIQSLGLFVIVLGVQMALKGHNFLVILISLVSGALIGETLNIDSKIKSFGDKIAQKVDGTKGGRFTQGFLTATMLYCVGAMAIVGAINQGLRNDSTLLLTKAVLDGVSSIFFAATFGWGVFFAFIPVLLYQGILTFLAQFLEPYLTALVIDELTGAGGVILIGIALGILEITEIRTANLLPALPIVVILTLLIPLTQ